MINQVLRRLNHRYVVETVTLHSRLNPCQLLLRIYVPFRFHPLRRAGYPGNFKTKLMRLLELEVFHGSVECLKLFIHCLVDLAHLDLDIGLVNLLSLDAVVIFDSRSLFGAFVAHLVEAMLSSLGCHTGVELIL